ncbi:MAG: capsid protein [Genomoviridae sp.]|uniref:capsid protein n=1 Tax=Genomoviridae sp. TaxID=2202565 RepID=UPI002481EAAB|nr:MAG: capsid protein [Genomoviridae sp.]QCW23609.1 MAG: capsid protein [Genomoviridae sp.]
MAYARRRFRRRQPVRRRRNVRRSSRRTTRPSYRRPRRTMTRRRVNDIASRKCRDTMTSWSDIENSVPTDTFANTGATISGGTTDNSFFVFQPTARTGINIDGDEGKFQPLSVGRKRTTVYMKGFKEHVAIATDTAASWSWRRIVVEVVGNPWLVPPSSSTSPTFRTNSAEGYKRLVTQNGAFNDQIYDTIFRGTNQADWVDAQIANLDRKRVKIHMDRKININAGSVGGVTRRYNFWTPINKNFTYDDEEDGEDINTSPFAANIPRNPGNFYILDLIVPGFGAGSEDTLQFTPNCTLYWHEK